MALFQCQQVKERGHLARNWRARCPRSSPIHSPLSKMITFLWLLKRMALWLKIYPGTFTLIGLQKFFIGYNH
jgi:hypothetical protein